MTVTPTAETSTEPVAFDLDFTYHCGTPVAVSDEDCERGPVNRRLSARLQRFHDSLSPEDQHTLQCLLALAGMAGSGVRGPGLDTAPPGYAIRPTPTLVRTACVLVPVHLAVAARPEQQR